MSKITVDSKACTKCGACVEVCATAGVFEIRDGSAFAVRPELCWGCGQCVSVCPHDAIDHETFPLEKFPLIDREREITLDELTAALRGRRSVRTFVDRPVPRDLVRELISQSRWCPSASNSQDVDWVVLDDRARIAELSKATVHEIRRFARLLSHPLLRGILGLLFGRDLVKNASQNRRAADDLLDRWAKGIDPIFYSAPAVLIAHTRKRRPFARDDAAFAAYNLMLAADHLGLATCQMGILQLAATHSRKVWRLLGLPEERTAQIALALGYSKFGFRRTPPRRMPEITWNPR